VVTTQEKCSARLRPDFCLLYLHDVFPPSLPLPLTPPLPPPLALLRSPPAPDQPLRTHSPTIVVAGSGHRSAVRASSSATASVSSAGPLSTASSTASSLLSSLAGVPTGVTTAAPAGVSGSKILLAAASSPRGGMRVPTMTSDPQGTYSAQDVALLTGAAGVLASGDQVCIDEGKGEGEERKCKQREAGERLGIQGTSMLPSGRGS